MAIYQLREKQKIPASAEEVWDFISTPANLSRITPEYMRFEITTPDMPEKMYPGMIIVYWVRPLLGIRMSWVTEITHIREGHYFVDEQRSGPYALWHHEHFLEPDGEGVVMSDIVTYKLPFGFLGRIAQALFVRKQLREIFDYRREAMENRFGKA